MLKSFAGSPGGAFGKAPPGIGIYATKYQESPSRAAVKSVAGARWHKKVYVDFVEAGIGRGHGEDLIGGGLIRSVAGWAEVKSLKRSGREHVMSDELIPGSSSFVETLLSQADEQYERRYKLNCLGYDADSKTRSAIL
jgi:hypothetical protein